MTNPVHTRARWSTVSRPATGHAPARSLYNAEAGLTDTRDVSGADSPSQPAGRATALGTSSSTDRRRRAVGAALAWLAAVLCAWLPASPAAAAAPAPGFTLTSLSEPTNFAPGDATGSDVYAVTATDAGAMPTDGTPITLTDNLPAGLSASSVDFYWSGRPGLALPAFLCTTTPTQCHFPIAMQPGQTLTMYVHVTNTLSQGASVTNSVSIIGGGAPTVNAGGSNEISSAPAAFGIQHFEVDVLGPDGAPNSLAGDHPYELVTNVNFNSTTTINSGGDVEYLPPADPKQLIVDLPPGLIGNPTAAPQCSQGALIQKACPPDSQIGTITIVEPNNTGPNHGSTGQVVDTVSTDPLYNMAPPHGVAAELAFLLQDFVPIVLDGGVRTGAGYGLVVRSGLINSVGLKAVSTTIWGVPGDPSHDAQRGQHCNSNSSEPCFGGGQPYGAELQPFLTNPTSCTGDPLGFSATTSSWQAPNVTETASTSLAPLTGCDALSFVPSLSVAPDSSQAGQPTGLGVDLQVPQTSEPNQLATPELRDATVTLPEGMTINPSSGDGLAGCSDVQIALSSPDPGSCPDASKIGSVELHTPLLDHSLPGDVYLGTPLCDPCTPSDAASGRMVRLFIQIDDPASGVVIKLPGTVSINQTTGQLTTTFLQNPQLPFDELKLTLKSGPRAPLVNPTTCGTFTTTSDLAPWSAPFSGPDATPSSSFDITGCGDPSTFSPSFTAGVSNPQAGSYSPFVLSFSRSDSDQFFQGLTVKMPPGVAAKLAGVPLCSDSDANAGTCPDSSQVGTVETGAGAGSEPLFLPGKAYLTGPYKGAPYGLAVAVPAIAGPFNLGMVVVRQALNVDPTTAQVTAVSDPFPTQLDGIPLRIRRVDVNLNRPDFVVNPTSCDPMSIDGTLSSTGGMTAPMSSRFQVGGCQDLGFSPKLKFALTGKGQTHSGQHPTLTATLTQGAGQANIQSAKVALPLSLALDTNNSSNVCNYDVAQAVHGGAVGCPASTIVGHATAVTPLLSQPLSGNVYLVQGIRFGPQGQRIRTLPSLLVPLRGQIALDLRASSSVNGAQQLVTTFSTIPDAPVSSFTLQINGGSKGILVITGRGKSICGKAQVGNANFGAQSGKADYQNPKFSTPACKGVTHHRRHRHK